MRIGFDAKRAAQNATGLGNYSRFVIGSLLDLAPGNDYLLYVPSPSQNRFLGRRLHAWCRHAGCGVRARPSGVSWGCPPTCGAMG